MTRRLRWNQGAHPEARYAPEEIRRLPFELNRSSLYPRHPAQAAAAIESMGENPQNPPRHPQFLPQRMAFQRWKTNPGQPAFGYAIQSPLAAQQTYGSLLRSVSTPPTFTAGPEFAKRARGADRLPQPSDNWTQNIPITPGYQEMASERIPPSALDEMAQRQSTNEQASNIQRTQRTAFALSQVETQLAGLRGRIGRR